MPSPDAPAASHPALWQGWRGFGWIVASSIALLATSRWLSVTSVEYLVIAAAATAMGAAALLDKRLQITERRWAASCVLALAVALALGTRTQYRKAGLERDTEGVRARVGTQAVDNLAMDVKRAEAELTTLAACAVAAGADASNDRARTFDALVAATPDEQTSVILFRGDSAFAWAGTPRMSVSSAGRGAGAGDVGVIGTPLYLALYATKSVGTWRAVATRILYASSPADRLVHTLGGDVAARVGVAGFRFVPVTDSALLIGAGARVVHSAGGTGLFAVRATLLTQGELQLRLLERARVMIGVLLGLALACFVVGAWRAQRALRWRSLLVLVGLACVALTPLSSFSNSSRLFDPGLYYTPLGRALTANAAALALTSSLVLLMLLTALRHQTRVADRRLAVAIVAVAAGLGPFLLRDLSRGIQIPQHGVSASLWLIWEVPLFLAAACVILAGAAAGSAALGRSRGLSPIVAPALAVVASVLAPIVWEAPFGWPGWYTFLWIAAIVSLAVSRRSAAVIVAAATVAALGATTLVWGATTRARVRLAEADVATLGTGDPYARTLAERLGRNLMESPALTRRALLEAYANSDLVAAGFPVWLAVWRGNENPTSIFATAPLVVPMDSLRRVVVRATAQRAPISADIPGNPSVEHAIVVPSDSGTMTVVVGPQTRLLPGDPFARLFGVGLAQETEPPYTVQLTPLSRVPSPLPERSWRREENELHGDWIAPTGAVASRVHAEVELRGLDVLVQRGTLIALLNLAIVGLLWFTSVLADGVAIRWIAVRRRRWARSYRVRLTLALFAFFMIPAIAFAVWSYRQLSTDATRSRELLVRETLRSVTPGADSLWLARESARLESPLFLYRRGELATASDSLLQELAPIGSMLPPEVAQALLVHGEVSAHRLESVGEPATVLFGYRALDIGPGVSAVIAAPARADELALGRRARDLGVLVAFATAVGALAALWLSGIAARQLARPIGSLRKAALALAGGEREPVLEGEPTAEFLPVFAAFRRMMSDLNASRSALEEAGRRTSAVLRNAASGVIAVDDHGAVTLANPRADVLFGARLVPGTRLSDVAPRELAELLDRFLAGSADDEAFEMPHGEQQWRGRLTRLTRGGAVVTVDDVSEIARAERVLAWGEMARQIAHEIKNPLTPIRLGVQHLRRARSDSRVDFDRVLEQNVERILKEIDRLDEIARAFSRYGQPPEQRGGAEATDVTVVLRDLIALENMGGESQLRWSLRGADAPMLAMARKEELREVLLNVFENARLAKAAAVDVSVVSADGRVRIEVKDNGQGIPADVMHRIFEPHFSTRTSGSGLGLAISRRVIESWGGVIALESLEGFGTTVKIELAQPPAARG